MKEWSFAGKDGAELFAREWQPELEDGRDVRAVLCLVHGMGEYSGRYDAFARSLAAGGIASIAYDQRGHGRTAGPRGHADGMDQLAEDAAAAVREAAKLYPGAPLFLYGHSMGGGVALHAALTVPLPASGLILSSPWLSLVAPPPRIAEAAVGLLAKLWPTFSQPTGIKQEDLFRPGAQAGACSVMDEYCHKRITAKMYRSISTAGEKSILRAKELAFPVLLVHGTSDRITSFAASERLANAIGSNCTFAPQEGGYHELHHDLEREALMNRLKMWIYANLDCKKSPPVL